MKESIYGLSDKYKCIFLLTRYIKTDSGYISDKKYCFRDKPFHNNNKEHIFNIITDFKYANKQVGNPYDILQQYCFKDNIGIKYNAVKKLSDSESLFKEMWFEINKIQEIVERQY